jgi:hypothetical protein
VLDIGAASPGTRYQPGSGQGGRRRMTPRNSLNAAAFGQEG